MSGTSGNTNRVSFIERYAPSTFNDLVFAQPIVRQRLALYATNTLHNSIILHGPFGTAKSLTGNATATSALRDRNPWLAFFAVDRPRPQRFACSATRRAIRHGLERDRSGKI